MGFQLHWIPIHQTADQHRHSQAASRGPSHVVIGSRLVPQEHTGFANGTLVDAGLATPIIGNNTTIVVDLSVPDADGQGTTQIPIGQGAVNTSTGAFSVQFTAPEDLGSSVYEMQISFEFYRGSDQAGPYYVMPFSGDLFRQMGLESEFTITPSPHRLRSSQEPTSKCPEKSLMSPTAPLGWNISQSVARSGRVERDLPGIQHHRLEWQCHPRCHDAPGNSPGIST